MLITPFARIAGDYRDVALRLRRKERRSPHFQQLFNMGAPGIEPGTSRV